MTNSSHSTLYTGVTSDLHKRILQHRTGTFPNAFTKRYRCFKLVYFQYYPTIHLAIEAEKRLKGGSREKKIRLIEGLNPTWMDLFKTL